MTKEEQNFNKWFDEYADGVKVFEETDMKIAYLQGCADEVEKWEKINGELRTQLEQAKKLLEKWLFFNGFNSALKKETEDFLGKKTEEIEIPEGVEEIKWQRMNLMNN
jgi:hypothetical protein